VQAARVSVVSLRVPCVTPATLCEQALPGARHETLQQMCRGFEAGRRGRWLPSQGAAPRRLQADWCV